MPALPRRALALLLAAAVTAPLSTLAQRVDIAVETPAPGSRVAPAQVRDDAPAEYVVKPGDTLWGIAGMYLKDPWRWPELLRENRNVVRNPRQLRVGDVLVLRRSAAPVQAAGPDEVVVELIPTVRVDGSTGNAVPAIPINDIRPWLVERVVVAPDALDAYRAGPQIVAGRNSARSMRAEGDVMYATGLERAAGDRFDIYRQGRPLKAFGTGEVLGYEQRRVGAATVERFGDDTLVPRDDPRWSTVASTIRIIGAREEIQVGDQLLPARVDEITTEIVPYPAAPLDAHIIGTSVDTAEIARGWIITIDRGRDAGLGVGAVVALFSRPDDMQDPRPDPGPTILTRFFQQTTEYFRDRRIEIPDERSGLAMVFRVEERVAYALVLDTKLPVRLGDPVRAPYHP